MVYKFIDLRDGKAFRINVLEDISILLVAGRNRVSKGVEVGI